MQQLKDKQEKSEEELTAATDNLLLSLGVKTGRVRRGPSKRMKEMYDTTLGDGDDDDFFDRTAATNLGKKSATVDPAAWAYNDI
eukprot:1904082-Amphidinium_carterae.1